MSYQFKCIIAEDERRMANLVRLLGHWDDFQIDIVDICYNGIDAFDSIIKNKPNLVITDIKMPGHDGLALIEKCRENSIECAFIIVSGYKHFEYAKSAMQYGVVDYILKPIDEEQLNTAIGKSIQIIKEKNTSGIIKTERDEYFDKYQNIKYSDFWRQLFLSAYNNRSFLKEKYIEILPSEETSKVYRIIFIRTSIDYILDKNTLFREKLGTLLKSVETARLSCLYQYSQEGIYILLNYENDLDIYINQVISGIYYKLSNLTEIFDDFDLSFGYSNKTSSISDLVNIMREAISAESSKFVYGKNKIISFEMIRNLPRFIPQSILTDEIVNHLKDAYEYLKINAIYDLHQEVLKKCEKYHSSNPWDMIKMQQYLVDVTLSLFINNVEELEVKRIDIWWISSQTYRFVDFINLTLMTIEKYFEDYLLEQKQIHILPTEKALNFIF